MSTLYVVRHGQARLFTDDYDRLSPTGYEQARALGRFWSERNVRVDHAWTGALVRQRETARMIAESFRSAGIDFPEVASDDGFDEYPAEQIVAGFGRHLCATDSAIAQLAESLDRQQSEESRYRDHHRFLEAVIGCWFAEDYRGYEIGANERSYADWRNGLEVAFRGALRAAGRGSTTIIVTSGGVIGTLVQTVLRAPTAAAAELNWRVHNASVTQFTFSGSRISLDRFNDVAHLAPSELTYR